MHCVAHLPAMLLELRHVVEVFKAFINAPGAHIFHPRCPGNVQTCLKLCNSMVRGLGFFVPSHKV